MFKLLSKNFVKIAISEEVRLESNRNSSLQQFNAERDLRVEKRNSFFFYYYISEKLGDLSPMK